MMIGEIEISGKGIFVGILILLLLAVIPLVVWSMVSITGGIIGGLGISDIMFLTNWFAVYPMMIVAGIIATYIGKYQNMYSGVITGIILSVIYFIPILLIQSFLIPALSPKDIVGVTSPLGTVPITPAPEVYNIIGGFTKAFVLCIIGGLIGVLIVRKKLRSKPTQ